MELKLAREHIQDKPKVIKIEKIEEDVKKEIQSIFYFDRENSHKDIMNMGDHFKKLGYSVYTKEVKYGLDDKDYIYEVHIL